MSISTLDTHPLTNMPEYTGAFWKYIRKDEASKDMLSEGARNAVGGYELPTNDSIKFTTARNEESIFRKLATTYRFSLDGKCVAYEHDDVFSWIEEYGSFPVEDIAGDFTTTEISSYKLGTILKIHEDLARDTSFSLEKYITKRLAKSCAKAEDAAFTTGDGSNCPVGILDDTAGAETGTETSALSYDEIVNLFFSVKPDYRKNAVWMMNDNTAMALRKLTDESGFPLWNHNSDTIFGKPVIINNDMPDAESRSKPIAFGDFSYYWIIDRRRVSIQNLLERFILDQYIGIQAFEFLDAKLVRRDAIKVMKITA